MVAGEEVTLITMRNIVEQRDGAGETYIRPDGTLIRFEPPFYLGLAGTCPKISAEMPPEKARLLLSHLPEEIQLLVMNYFGLGGCNESMGSGETTVG
jgi:hypothetical protein